MTEAFKNLQIAVTKDDSGLVTKVVLPICDKEVNFVYDDEGGLEDLLDENGEVFDMEPIGTTDLGSFVYEAMYGAASIKDVSASGDIIQAAKVLVDDGDIYVLEFNEQGILKKETNPKYESIYLLNTPEGAAQKITERIENIFNHAVVIVREYVSEAGETVNDVALLGNVVEETTV